MQLNQVFNTSRTALKLPVSNGAPVEEEGAQIYFDSETGRATLKNEGGTPLEIPAATPGTEGELLAVDSEGRFSSAEPAVRYKEISLTAAEILGMYASPKVLLAAVTGKTHVIHKLRLDFTNGGTQFAAGGDVVAQYTTGAVAAIAVIADTVIQAAAASKTVRNGIDVAAVVSSAISLTNASGAFTTGNGTAVVRLWYSTI